MDLLIDSADYDHSMSGLSNSLELAEYAVSSSLSPRYTIIKPKEDSRFEKFSIFKAHGCFAYSFKVWAASESQNLFQNYIIKPLSLVSLPLFHSIDAIDNFALAHFQSLVFLRNYQVKFSLSILKYFLAEKDLPQFKEIETTALKTWRCFFTSLTNIFTEGLFWWMLSWGDLLKTGLRVFDEKNRKYKKIVDQSKLDWIIKKYGPIEFNKTLLEPRFDLQGIPIKPGPDGKLYSTVAPEQSTFFAFTEEERDRPTVCEYTRTWKIDRIDWFSGILELSPQDRSNYNQKPLYEALDK